MDDPHSPTLGQMAPSFINGMASIGMVGLALLFLALKMYMETEMGFLKSSLATPSKSKEASFAQAPRAW